MDERQFFMKEIGDMKAELSGMHSELRGLRVPFGPFLCLGAFVSLMWGESLLFWWLCFLQG